MRFLRAQHSPPICCPSGWPHQSGNGWRVYASSFSSSLLLLTHISSLLLFFHALAVFCKVIWNDQLWPGKLDFVHQQFNNVQLSSEMSIDKALNRLHGTLFHNIFSQPNLNFIQFWHRRCVFGSGDAASHCNCCYSSLLNVVFFITKTSTWLTSLLV